MTNSDKDTLHAGSAASSPAARITKETTPGAATTDDQGRVDRLGALASSLCAVHCALAALLPASLGALGLGFLLGERAEWLFTIIAMAFAAGASVLGWRRHRSRLVVTLLALGIAGLLASRMIEMGSGHHDHGEAPHHVAAEPHGGHGDRADAEPAGHHAGETHEEDHHGLGGAHGAGTAVGVFAGLLLLAGHILNLRADRARAEQCHT